MWLAGCDWDDPVPDSLEKKAIRWFAELPELAQVNVPRCVHYSSSIPTSTSLHVFADASEQAYGPGELHTTRLSRQQHLLPTHVFKSSSRTADSNMNSTDGVDGCRVNLAEATVQPLRLELRNVHFWTDSQNVLGWIHNASHHLKPFVANRVGEIHRATQLWQWQYVATKSNLAVLLTRGLTATQLAECASRWNGRVCLAKSENAWPTGPALPPVLDTTEMKCRVHAHSHLTFQHHQRVPFFVVFLCAPDPCQICRVIHLLFVFVQNHFCAHV